MWCDASNATDAVVASGSGLAERQSKFDVVRHREQFLYEFGLTTFLGDAVGGPGDGDCAVDLFLEQQRHADRLNPLEVLAQVERVPLFADAFEFAGEFVAVRDGVRRLLGEAVAVEDVLDLGIGG